MTAWILAGGPVSPSERLLRQVAGARLVVAADGGLRHAETLGLDPTVVVGDLDSVDGEVLDRWRHVPIERHPTDKDATDLELAADHAVRCGASALRVVGAFGGRLDQTLAAAAIATTWAERGLDVALLDGTAEVRPVAGGASLALDVPEGTTFSVLAVTDEAIVRVQGARYENERLVLPRGVGLGTSNVALSQPTVTAVTGTVLVVVSFQAEVRA